VTWNFTVGMAIPRRAQISRFGKPRANSASRLRSRCVRSAPTGLPTCGMLRGTTGTLGLWTAAEMAATRSDALLLRGNTAQAPRTGVLLAP
jgi:hypothetical protein